MSKEDPKYTRLRELYENQIEITDDYRNTINVLRKSIEIKDKLIRQLQKETLKQQS